MYCKKCGSQVRYTDAFCSKCGFSLPRNEKFEPLYNNQPQQEQSNRPQPEYRQQYQEYSEKNGLVVLILAIFLGYLGIHSFYAGRIGIGIAQLITLGGFGIWVLVDIILLITGSYNDGDGKRIELN